MSVSPHEKPRPAPRTIRSPEFAERLKEACDGNPNVPEHHGRQIWIKRELHKQFDEDVSPETVRKWFAGETKPVDRRVRLLATLLGVDEAWLALGRKFKSPAHVAEDQPKADLSIPRGVFMLERLRDRLGGTVKVAPGVDLTAPTGEIWDAEA